MAMVYDSLSSSSLCGARLVASLSVLETLSTLILSAPRLLALAVLLALSSCLLTVLLGLTFCCALSGNTYLSVSAVEIASHQQQDENTQEEDQGKEA